MLTLDEVYRRPVPAPERVKAVLGELQVNAPLQFVDFFTHYRGPFGSEKTAFEMAELCEPQANLDQSIPQSTFVGRSVHDLPKKFLVLSNMVAHAVLVYDTERDLVFNMDFEGGLELLKDGALEPEHAGFQEFLEWYFESDPA
jgi:hypothetical protein